MSLTIPNKYKKLEELMNEKSMGMIAKFIQHGVHAYGVTPRTEAPVIAGIYLLNGMKHEYETIRKYADKHYGKQGTATKLFEFVLENDLGLELATQMWKDRNTRTAKNFYTVLGVTKDEYLDMILSTPKFYRQFEVDSGIDWYIESIATATNLLKKGTEYPKFMKYMVVAAQRFGDDRLLPQDAREIFLF